MAWIKYDPPAAFDTVRPDCIIKPFKLSREGSEYGPSRAERLTSADDLRLVYMDSSGMRYVNATGATRQGQRRLDYYLGAQQFVVTLMVYQGGWLVAWRFHTKSADCAISEYNRLDAVFKEPTQFDVAPVVTP